MPDCIPALSKNSKRLVQKIQELRYGAIEHLLIENGEPIFCDETKIIRDRKFGKNDSSDIRKSSLDKEQFAQLFSEFASIQDGLVLVLEIHSGLPFRIRTQEKYFG